MKEVSSEQEIIVADVYFIDGFNGYFDRYASRVPIEKVVIASGSRHIRKYAKDIGYRAINPDEVLIRRFLYGFLT